MTTDAGGNDVRPAFALEKYLLALRQQFFVGAGHRCCMLRTEIRGDVGDINVGHGLRLWRHGFIHTFARLEVVNRLDDVFRHLTGQLGGLDGGKDLRANIAVDAVAAATNHGFFLAGLDVAGSRKN